eukprot:XP_019927359.1 PREDICTED: uncharacterized protein LOC105339294 [Crassostrea gigas]
MAAQKFCFVLLNQVFLIQSDLCPGENGKKCCIGFKWNDAHGNCLPCDEGYYGSNCSSKCRFPMYGVNCMSNCNCSAINCHHVYGCVKSEEANVTTTDYLDELTLLSEKEKEPFKTNGVVYSIIGLAAISVLLIILYLCSHLLEKY